MPSLIGILPHPDLSNAGSVWTGNLIGFLYTLFDKKLGYAEVTTNCIPRFTFKAVKNILFVALPDI